MARTFKSKKVLKDAEYKERYERQESKKKESRKLRDTKRKHHVPQED